jgi:uncharacterized protein YkvS
MRHELFQNTINIAVYYACECLRVRMRVRRGIIGNIFRFFTNLRKGHVEFTSVCELVLVLTLLDRFFLFDLELKITA